MIFAGKRTFNQLLDSDEGIATNVLRDRLNSLVDRGLLTKSDDPERKGRTRYALTERDRTRARARAPRPLGRALAVGGPRLAPKESPPLHGRPGAELVDELERYEDIYRLCYVRGPQWIIVELAERIG